VGRAGTANYFGGSLDELALYGTALTATQVSDHYLKGLNVDQTINYAYDQNGNDLSAGATTFQYDLENRLVSVSAPGGTTDAYTYDANGNRIADFRAGRIGPNITMHYFWDQLNGVPQLATEVEDTSDAPGVWSATYTYGAHRIGMNTGGASYYYHYDGLGSVVNLTSATGATQWTYAYEPFGNARTQTQNGANAPPNSFRFTGEYLDSTGLYNLRAREYDPAAGRFTAVDPLPPQSACVQSSYVYAADEPTVLTDPSGQRETDFPWAPDCSRFASSKKRKPPSSVKHDAARDALYLYIYVTRWAHVVNGQFMGDSRVLREYGIPGSGPKGGRGRADIALLAPRINSTDAYYWEVKPNNFAGISAGILQLIRYVSHSPTGVFLRGHVGYLTYYNTVVPSKLGLLHVWDTGGGLALYEDQPQQRTPSPSPCPDTSPVPVPAPGQEPVPGTVPEPVPEPVPIFPGEPVPLPI
jgi:RHS repeat-associated protein